MDEYCSGVSTDGKPNPLRSWAANDESNSGKPPMKQASSIPVLVVKRGFVSYNYGIVHGSTFLVYQDQEVMPLFVLVGYAMLAWVDSWRSGQVDLVLPLMGLKIS
ncbi:hypothetical protein PIB30_003269 [Stylosanthes scabra]|uniref:Uncharacterized protein n=1 Tax=Stylosanthes scabra TaxID=79078 RepID=A0ABU6S2P7_9FABA|nr:hypothetical protein [Stylosanthes scabra]